MLKKKHRNYIAIERTIWQILAKKTTLRIWAEHTKSGTFW